MTSLEKLHEALEEDNQASMALLIQVLIRKRYDLIEQAAEVAFCVIKDGERLPVVDAKYKEVYLKLRNEGL